MNETDVSEATRAVISTAYASARRGHDRARDLKHQLEGAG